MGVVMVCDASRTHSRLSVNGAVSGSSGDERHYKGEIRCAELHFGIYVDIKFLGRRV